MAQRVTEISTEPTPSEVLTSAMTLLSGRAVGASSLSRRRALQGLLMGTAGLALTPLAMGQVEIPPGQIRLMFNENPYGPSPKALAEVAKILPKTAYYPGAIEDDLMGLFMARHQLDREQVFLASGSNEGLQAAMMAFGVQSSIRTASSLAANPPNTTECTAPIRAQASMASIASGTMGI